MPSGEGGNHPIWVDRRAVRIRLTAKGRGIRDHVAALFERHAQRMDAEHILSFDMFDSTARTLRRMERFWGDQIRYIY